MSVDWKRLEQPAFDKIVEALVRHRFGDDVRAVNGSGGDDGVDIGDYQPVLIEGPVHELLCTERTAGGQIEWFPAHPHEGLVSATGPFATAIAQGRSAATGRHFNLAVVIDGEHTPDGRPMGRAVAESTFHHFADYNWDLDCGAPSFVTEAPGNQIKADPLRLEIFKDYVRNVATWLQLATRLSVAV